MYSPPNLSIIIPTYHRPEALKRTLGSLNAQKWLEQTSPVPFEVIIVDNSSTRELSSTLPLQEPISLPFSFALRIIRTDALGPTISRNLGAQQSKGDLLVFLDDDICINPTGLQALITHFQQAHRTIFLGVLTLPQEILETSIYARAFNDPIPKTDQEIHYTHCKTGLLAVRKEDFFALDQFQDPTGGWPNWDDVDFGVRANRQGFHFRLCVDVIGEHWDYAARSLDQAAKRLQKAGVSAVRLMQVYPELRDELPMFRDMLPYNPEADTPHLKMRKVARRVASNRLFLWPLEKIVRILEEFRLPAEQMYKWYTWITGGYIFRGVQEGIKKYGPLPVR